jgi:hypothetical protein
MGADGWELVSFLTAMPMPQKWKGNEFSNPWMYHAIFKRQANGYYVDKQKKPPARADSFLCDVLEVRPSVHIKAQKEESYLLYYDSTLEAAQLYCP